MAQNRSRIFPSYSPWLMAVARVLALTLPVSAVAALAPEYQPAPDQPADQSYGEAIARYTTDPSFNSPLTRYLPASSSVPTPAAVLGDIAGAPNYLPYAADVHRYFRMLEKATPRVRTFVIGKTEEGREILGVLVADESLLKDLDGNLDRLSQLADPRKLGLDDARAEPLITATKPVYYITGAIHSPETGSPTALMELAYRLAVDDSPYIQRIRNNVITLITPVVEVDGRERMVDLYRWHRAHPEQTTPDLMYWGHYVAHDNNRDGITLKLNLTRAVLDTYVKFNPVVLHDLHESVPFLYDNTIGDSPYNAWIDPILANEWQMIGWSNVGAMTQMGMPGVFAHGDFDTWTPGYLMFIAAMRNGISRLYETFGNGGADTRMRILDPSEYDRTWYRQNPPWPKVLWSQRDNNNYQETGLLTSLDYAARNAQPLLRNFWLKSKRSITKPQDAGPAAYVIPAEAAHRPAQRRLLRLLKAQHVEVQQLQSRWKQADGKLSLSSGSYVIRMDQPFSRTADVLLDRQYWSPDEVQKNPYDDTGWTLGPLFGVDVRRVTETSLLREPMKRVDNATGAFDGAVDGSGQRFVVDAANSASVLGLAYALPQGSVQVAAGGKGSAMPAGSLYIDGVPGEQLEPALRRLGLDAQAVRNAPKGEWKAFNRPRIALLHTWIETQNEGWWRLALDELGIPYDYLSTQDIAGITDLKARYDVLLFAPVAVDSRMINDGLPMYGNALPWKTTALTPNIGRIDSTEDTRPGLGMAGVERIRQFVADGGLLLASQQTARWAVDMGLAPGVGFADMGDGFKVYGTVLEADRVDAASPVMAGYEKPFAVYSAQGMAFTVSAFVGRDPVLRQEDVSRPTGRGGPDDIDEPQGRRPVAAEPLPDPKPWEIAEPNAEQAHDNPLLIPDVLRPQVLLRFADADKLLVSGLLFQGSALAGRPAVVQAAYGKGNTMLFAINPLWRGETIGSEAMVSNALLNWDRLR